MFESQFTESNLLEPCGRVSTWRLHACWLHLQPLERKWLLSVVSNVYRIENYKGTKKTNPYLLNIRAISKERSVNSILGLAFRST